MEHTTLNHNPHLNLLGMYTQSLTKRFVFLGSKWLALASAEPWVSFESRGHGKNFLCYEKLDTTVY